MLSTIGTNLVENVHPGVVKDQNTNYLQMTLFTCNKEGWPTVLFNNGNDVVMRERALWSIEERKWYGLQRLVWNCVCKVDIWGVCDNVMRYLSKLYQFLLWYFIIIIN